MLFINLMAKLIFNILSMHLLMTLRRILKLFMLICEIVILQGISHTTLVLLLNFPYSAGKQENPVQSHPFMVACLIVTALTCFIIIMYIAFQIYKYKMLLKC